MDPLLPSFRRELRARAHALDPVVAIGQHGLTPAVLHEIDVALKAHELIKVRVFNGDREARSAMLGRIIGALDCAPAGCSCFGVLGPRTGNRPWRSPPRHDHANANAKAVRRHPAAFRAQRCRGAGAAPASSRSDR